MRACLLFATLAAAVSLGCGARDPLLLFGAPPDDGTGGSAGTGGAGGSDEAPPEWSRAFGVNAVPIGVATDPAGGAVVFGALIGPTVFDESTVLVPDDTPDFFLLRLTPEGLVDWARQYPSNGSQVAVIGSVAVAPDGAILISGGANGGVDLGDGMLPGAGEIVAKLTAEGDLVWADRPSGSWGRGALDPAGNFVTVGWSECYGGFSCIGAFNVTKHAADGALLWEAVYPKNEFGSVRPMAMAVDPSGATTFSAILDGAAQVGPFALSCLGGCMLLVKHGPDGALLWAKTFQDDAKGDLYAFEMTVTQIADEDEYPTSSYVFGPSATGMAAFPDGSLAMTGHLFDHLSLGGPPLQGGSSRMFLARLGPDGEHLWSRTAGGPVTSPPALTVSSTGDLHLAASAADPGLDFGGGPLAPRLAFGRLTPSGDHLSSSRVTGDDPWSWIQVAPDLTGGIYFAIRTRGQVDTDLAGSSGKGLLVARLSP